MTNGLQRKEDLILEEYGLQQLSVDHKSNLFGLLPLFPIIDEETYQKSMENLDVLLNMAQTNAELFDNLTVKGAYLVELSRRIEDYESKSDPIPDVSGVEMLKFLMEQNSITQKELSEEIFGGHQGNLSQILNGDRKLSVSHITKLSKRFNISADAFLGD